MSQFSLFIISVVFSFFTVSGCVPSKLQVSDENKTLETSHDHEKEYWTCSMHPQIHKNESGKCHICGMPLILVSKNAVNEKKEDVTSAPRGIDLSEIKIQNAKISKYTVFKKDFTISIEFSGRLTSGRDLNLQVYESDRNLVFPNLKISGYATVNPGEIIKGKISRIDNFVDPLSRTIRITAKLDSDVANFVSDSSFYGQIQNTLKNQLVIPEEAVLHTGQSDLVYIFNTSGNLEPRKIILGHKNKAEYQIISGLEEGDVISSGANFLIDSESKIRGM